KPAEGQSLLDVCSTCHANATCDDKSDGSGKVCNCKYGFVGNGRTFCQECQIGSTKICGQHTTCHNTFGSYYCTCLAGYSPSNNMAVFIPNDGTHCQIDECGITGQCGEGAQCRNLEGSFDCSCQVGYKIHNGVEPFNPLRDKASCKVVNCGPPALLEDTVLVSVTGTTYSSVATFICDEGFVWRRGDNSSVCGAEGLWSKPNMVVDCGSPPAVPHSRLLWNKSTRMGTEVVYQCNSGYHNVGKGNVSICTAAGQWAILCGNPPVIEFTGQVWSYNSTPGSTVLYFCKDGFYNKGGNNVSTCQENGQWTSPTLSCQVDCGKPPLIPNSVMHWDKISTVGSKVIYQCKPGYLNAGTGNVSVCSAKCGPAPFLANSEVVWHNRSVVIHRCVAGYHSWRGSNVSVCGSSGEWQKATLREIKPPINHLLIFNESCLQWKAEKYEEDTEVYKVTYTGSRDYQRSFYDKRKRFLSSKADQLKLCLGLLPVTNYSITVTATSARFTASVTTNTSLPPPGPVVYYREFDTPLPTLSLRRSPNTLDLISLYQVFVLPVEGFMMFNCSSPAIAPPLSTLKSPAEYIAAQFEVHRVGTEMNLTIGDGLLYGGFYNAPLESGKNYYIILRAVSQWKS
uniref:Sushi domain containing 1 n=1 Tax=Neolamprologus brichardi TaxID=32507 RepID=A0A3Q4ML16_NEOBR